MFHRPAPSLCTYCFEQKKKYNFFSLSNTALVPINRVALVFAGHWNWSLDRVLVYSTKSFVSSSTNASFSQFSRNFTDTHTAHTATYAKRAYTDSYIIQDLAGSSVAWFIGSHYCFETGEYFSGLPSQLSFVTTNNLARGMHFSLTLGMMLVFFGVYTDYSRALSLSANLVRSIALYATLHLYICVCECVLVDVLGFTF